VNRLLIIGCLLFPSARGALAQPAELFKLVARSGADHRDYSRTDTRWKTSMATESFDATFYGLDLRVEMSSNSVMGNVRIVGVARAPQDELRLDLADEMMVDSVLSASGESVAYGHRSEVLTMAFPLGTGEVGDLTVYYHGAPKSTGLGGFVFGELANGDPFAWTLSEPYAGRSWWPSKDHPSDKADSVDVFITVAEPLRVGSNGLLQEVRDVGAGYRQFRWRHRYPIATYLVSVAAGVYDYTEQVYERPSNLSADFGPLRLPIQHYTYAGNNAFEGSHPQFGFRYITEIFPILEGWFGPYPFDREKYGHAQFTFGGAMEHQTLSSMTTNYRGTMAHELAHQWFGDMISPRAWPHVWLNEGFATFGELAYWRDSEFPEVYDQIFDIYYDRAQQAVGTVIVQDTTNVLDMFAHSRIYSKGWMVLRMLRGMLGDEAFTGALRDYATDPATQYGTAATEDFQRVAEAVSGLDLDVFFRQWVTEGTGFPTYEMSWTFRPEAGRYRLDLQLNQTQELPQSNMEVFRMPIWIRVGTAAGAREILVYNDLRSQHYTLLVDAEPRSLMLDPDRWILRSPEVTITGTEETSLPAGTPAIVSAWPNPTSDVLFVEVSSPAPTELTVVDALGRNVLTAMSTPGLPTELRLENLPPGLYGVRILSGDRIDTRLFMVARARR
jgi:aminopeptidase N